MIENERMRIASNGNIGIGTSNPSYRMHICNNTIVATGTTGATCMPLRISAGEYSDTGNGTATLFGLSTQETAGAVWTKCAIGHCRTAQFDVGSIVFLCNNSATSSSVSMADERMRIASNGNIGIGTNNPSATLNVNGIVAIQTGTTGVAISDMTSGSLKLGNITQNYGSPGSGSTANMGCIIFECLDNTEIALHDSGNANHSLIRYTTGNNITMGRNFGWGVCSIFKGNNGTAWDQTSDHRIKENIKKANLNICYDNVKNINLYRFNYKDAFGNGTHRDRTQLGFVAQQVNIYYPKSITRGKRKLDDNREVPDLASIDVSQVNFTLFGAVKQLIRMVEKQSNRIKKLEDMLNIVEDGTVEDDADEPYVKIVCEGEVDIDTIVPSEPEETPENTSGSNSSNVF